MMKKIKRTLIVMLSVVMMFGAFTGCGSQTSVDESYISDMKAGLEARWDLVEEGEDDDESYEYWEALINAEYLKIQGYKDKKFENRKLGKLAKDYIRQIEGMHKALEKHNPNSNYDRFWNAYLPYYSQRNYDFKQIVDGEYGLKVDDEKYQDSFDELYAHGWGTELFNKIVFESKEDEWGSVTYEATVKNDSGYEFDYFQFEINELDKGGNTINTTYAEVQNWEPETERKFEFWPDEAMENYELVEASCAIK